MLVGFLRTKMKRIRPDIPEQEWSGISLRKGGATTAMRANVPDETISKLGHWKSTAFRSYMAHEPLDVITAQIHMSQLTQMVAFLINYSYLFIFIHL